MYDVATRQRALHLLASGQNLSQVSRSTGVNRSTLRAWQATPPGWESPLQLRSCVRCAQPPTAPRSPPDYSHLLGLYLGDGCLSRAGLRGVWVLRISCDDNWPGLQRECMQAMAATMPNAVSSVAAPGCHVVQAYSTHWPCLFPQHGPGLKHDRPIVLEGWQRDLVELDPRPFLRGLFHSDGCRITNWTVRTVAGERKRYEYPRYFFSNRSDDIRGLCTWALDLLEIPWRAPSRWDISVARREGVAALDEFVGPKY
jgi:hypothetical protein